MIDKEQLRAEYYSMIDKEQLRAAYLAGYLYAKAIEYGAEIYVEDRGFEEWYEREITDPPEGLS